MDDPAFYHALPGVVGSIPFTLTRSFVFTLSFNYFGRILRYSLLGLASNNPAYFAGCLEYLGVIDLLIRCGAQSLGFESFPATYRAYGVRALPTSIMGEWSYRMLDRFALIAGIAMANVLPDMSLFRHNGALSARSINLWQGIASSFFLVILPRFLSLLPCGPLGNLCFGFGCIVNRVLCAFKQAARLYHSFSFIVEAGSQPNHYQYEHLTTTRRIRLLRLLRTGSHISCDMVSVNLDDAPEYEAISYRWRDSSTPMSLILGPDGLELPLMKSVHEILQRLATSPGIPRYLWTDSICIDQKNTKEKEKQIPLMRDIYSRASRVIICLPNIAISPGFCAKLSRIQRAYEIYANKGDDSELSALLSDRRTTFELVEIMTNEYWFRSWIMQEIALARRLVILCDRAFLDWEVFTQVAMNLFGDHTFEGISTGQNTRNSGGFLSKFQVLVVENMRTITTSMVLKSIQAIRNKRVEDPDSHSRLWDLLVQFAPCEATIPSDRIYGLLGLSEEASEAELEPDYSKSHLMVFMESVKVSLRRGFLPPFHVAGLSYGEARDTFDKDFPSWLPVPSRMGSFKMNLRAELYSAGLAEMAFGDVSLVDMCATLGGVELGKILVCSSEAPSDGGYQEPTNITEDTLQDDAAQGVSFTWQIIFRLLEMESFIKKNLRDFYPDSASLEEAAWRTLIADHDGASRPAHPGARGMVGALLGVARQIFHENSPKTFESADTRSKKSMIRLGAAMQRADEICNTLGGRTNSIMLLQHLKSFKIAITENKLLAVVPRGTQTDDTLCVIAGSKLASVLRPNEARNCFQLWGPAYVHGFMDGEGFNQFESRKFMLI